MAWLRVESALPNHHKVMAAGGDLGRGSIGRVLGLWTVGACYSVAHLTDGFVPALVLDDARLDKQPKAVIAAMVRVGLIHAVEGGYQYHDFRDYNPSAAAVKDKRRSDLARKFQRDSSAIPRGIQTDSAEIPRGIQTDSAEIPRGIHADSNAIPQTFHAESTALARAPARARPNPMNTMNTDEIRHTSDACDANTTDARVSAVPPKWGHRTIPSRGALVEPVSHHARCFHAPAVCARSWCIPQFWGDRMVGQVQGDRAEVEKFLAFVLATTAAGPIGDPLRFWQEKWNVMHAPAKAAPARVDRYAELAAGVDELLDQHQANQVARAKGRLHE